MTTILVMLCVNDPDNGSPLGLIDGVEIGELPLRLEGPQGFDREFGPIGTTSFASTSSTITVGGQVFRHRGYSTWVGNWCWDAAHMTVDAVLALLNHLKAEGWDCHEAEESLYERWRRPQPLTMTDLIRAGWPQEASHA